MTTSILLICPEEIITHEEKGVLSVIDLNVVSENPDDILRLQASFVMNVVDDDLNRLPMNHFEFVYVGEACARTASVADPTFFTILLNRVMKQNSHIFINSHDISGLIREMKKNGFQKIKGVSQEFKKEYLLNKKQGFLFQKTNKCDITKNEIYDILGSKDKEYIDFLKESWQEMSEEEWKDIAEMKREEYGYNNPKTLNEEWIGLYKPNHLFELEEDDKKYAFVNQDIYTILMNKHNPYTGKKLSKDIIKKMQDVVYFGEYSISLREAVKDLFA